MILSMALMGHAGLVYNPSIQKAETKELEAQDYPQLQRVFEASLIYMKPCLNDFFFLLE